ARNVGRASLKRIYPAVGKCVLCLIGAVCVAVSAHVPAVVMLFCYVGLTCVNYWLGGRDMLYPSFIFCGCWTVAIAVYIFCPVRIDDLSWQTVAIFIGG